MKIKAKKLSSTVLRFDDNFALLLDIDDRGDFLYEFRFLSSTALALRNGATRVRLTVRTTIPSSPPNFFKGTNKVGDLRDFVGGILKSDALYKDTQRRNKAAILSSIFVDITAPIDKSLGAAIMAGASDQSVLGTQRVISLLSVEDLNSSNIDPPVLQTSLMDASRVVSNAEIRDASLDLLMGAGIDPTVVGTPSRSSVGTHQAFSGLNKTKSTLPSNSRPQGDVHQSSKHQATLVNSLHPQSPKQLNSKDDLRPSTKIPVISDVKLVYVSNSGQMKLPKASLGMDDFLMTFELMTPAGDVLETTTKKVGHNALVRLFNTPRVSPRVSIAPIQAAGRNVIEIQQKDPRATAVRIFRKRLSKTVRIDDAEYELVGDVSLSSANGLIKFVDAINNFNVVQYRCIPVGPGGILSSEFTNVVAPAVKSNAKSDSRINAISMYSKLSQDGIDVIVTSVPAGVVSIAPQRRDLTLHETSYSFIDVNDPVKPVVKGVDDVTFHDVDVKDGHDYEYTCLLYMSGGSIISSTATCIQRFLAPSVGVIDIDVNNVQIIRDSATPDIRFNISSTLIESSLDATSLALKRQGLSTLFQDELKAQRDDLQSLIAHNIIRIDLTSGTTETFGTFLGTNFSDRVVGQAKHVSKLVDGHRYKYIITTLLRDAETMFSKLQKQAVDPSTGKSYSYSPFKYQHPIALNKGTLVTQDTLRTQHAEDDFGFGQLGNPKEVTVTLDAQLPKMGTVTAARVGRRAVRVRWSVIGQLNRIEHFIILKENMGHVTISGKSHAFSQGKTFEFLDSLEPDDIGELSYSVVPVYSDYTRGNPAVSGKIDIVDGRSRAGG